MLDPIYFSDIAAAAAYWRDRPWKKWRVDITAGLDRRPSFARTFYAAGRDCGAAERAVRANTVGLIPRRARFSVRLAGPQELGCVATRGDSLAS